MIYAYGDDIHTKVWWYTIAFAMDKKRQSADCLFWSWKRDSNTRPMVVVKGELLDVVSMELQIIFHYGILQI